MNRRPPRSTLTYTPFPSTTLFRSADRRGLAATLCLDGMRGVGIRAKCTSTNERYASVQPGEDLAHALAGGGFLQRMNDRVSQHVFRELRLREIGRASCRESACRYV